jgi:TetR/AcrR family transcriptional regulator, cholesterol catabolism regulator
VNTQEAVLESARRCFGRYGYRKTSIDEVAVEAGVAKGTVYLHCESKQDLFVLAIEREVRLWLEDLSTAVDPSRPADEVMIEMARRDAAFVEQRPLVADLLIGALDGQLPDQRDRLHALRQVGLSQVVAVLELGIGQGVFADDIDVESTAQILQEMQLTGAVLRRRSLPLRQVRRRQEAALRLVLRGLQSR